MSIVPEIGDFDFDLTTMDTFDDLDISMENFDIVDTATDPFGDFSLEQSLNLVELNNAKNLLVDDFNSSGDSDISSFLGDFDIKETIKQDCMWSSAHDINSKSVNIKHKSRSQLDSKLSLTPPTSYINPNLMMFDTPLPSSDDDSSSTDSSSDEIDVVSGFNQCLLKSSIESSSSGDHCYTSGHGKSSSMLTPPESSEDEDSNHDIFKSKAAQDLLKTRKSALKEIENDRFNKVFKSILLKNSSQSMSTTNIDKAKFKFSICMNSNKKTSLLRNKSKQDKKSSRTTVSSYQGIKENKQTLKFSHGFQNKQHNRVTHLDRANREKSNHKEARDVHNQMERQRRTDLKNAFDQLKDFVPTIANSDRASKQMVLDKAIDHCKNLKMKETRVREERKNIVQRNELLKKKLALLESQIASCQVENADWEIQGW